MISRYFVILALSLSSMWAWASSNPRSTTAGQMIKDIAFTGGFRNNYKTTQSHLICSVKAKSNIIYVSIQNAVTKAEVEFLTIPYDDNEEILRTDTKFRDLYTYTYQFLRHDTQIMFTYFPITISFTSKGLRFDCFQK